MKRRFQRLAMAGGSLVKLAVNQTPEPLVICQLVRQACVAWIDQDALLRKTLMLQTQQQMVLTAVALARFQSTQGNEAPRLEALVPGLLPGLPRDCRHGSSERYVRKHWYRVKTAEGPEMKIYFERQQRSSGGSRWRLYCIRE